MPGITDIAKRKWGRGDGYMTDRGGDNNKLTVILKN